MSTDSLWHRTHRLSNTRAESPNCMQAPTATSAYPQGLRILFTLVLPVAFLTTVPAEALLGRASLPTMLSAVAVALLALAASRLFWTFALRHYTSASS